jgi:tetratricopeptide (TPR) repeat protein
MYDFPQDPKKIRARIRRYERALRQEQECYGFINDGAGKRYLLGPLYLLMGDTAGALRSFAWFAQTCPDDSGDPLQYLCWTLALYRAGELEHATAKLRQTNSP